MVKIRYVGYLAELVGKREVVVELRDPKPVKSLVDARIDPEDAIVLVNGRPADFERRVWGEDEVVLLPMASGG